MAPVTAALRRARIGVDVLVFSAGIAGEVSAPRPFLGHVGAQPPAGTNSSVIENTHFVAETAVYAFAAATRRTSREGGFTLRAVAVDPGAVGFNATASLLETNPHQLKPTPGTPGIPLLRGAVFTRDGGPWTRACDWDNWQLPLGRRAFGDAFAADASLYVYPMLDCSRRQVVEFF